jgi:hypothetical protein
MEQYPEPAPRFSDTVRHVVHFLRHPRLPEVSADKPEQETAADMRADKVTDVPVAEPLRIFIHLLGLSLLLGLGVVMLMGALQKAGLIPDLPHAMEDVMKSYSFALVFLLAAIVMPALEEFAFRLWLVFNPLYFLISLWLVAMFLHSTLIQVGGTYLGYGILALATLLTIWLLAFKEPAQRALQTLYLQQYGWVFYGATALFALLHLINFSPDLQILMLAPILVLPQLLLGFVLGYIRIRLGMTWAIALHGLYNALILLVAYTGMQADAATSAGLLWFFLKLCYA